MFADAALEAAVRDSLRLPPDSSISGESLARAGRIDADGRGISDLTGLECAIQLRYLIMPDNDVTDASPLVELPLEQVDLAGNRVSDLSTFASLPLLSTLDLSRNAISDVSDLDGHPQLERLILDDAQLTSTSTLGQMPNLTELSLKRNPLGSLEGLTGVPKLRTLHLDETMVTELGGLAPLSSLYELTVDGARLTSLADVPALSQLASLSAAGNRITDARFQSTLPELAQLVLSDNLITSAEGLEAARLPGLKGLGLSGNPLNGLESLAPAHTLLNLWIDDVGAVDLSPLTALSLWGLSARDNAITDLEPVADVSRLELAGNDIVDIGALAGTVHSLIDVSQNQIEDATPLLEVEFPTCGRVFLTGNPLLDPSSVIEGLCSSLVLVDSFCGSDVCMHGG